MVSLYWFEGPGPGRIGVMPRPELDVEIAEMRDAGVTTLVSLLERSEIELYGLEEEPGLCQGIDFLHYPIRDHAAPKDFATASALVKDLAARYRRGASIIVHCLGGVGRSPTIAGATLVDQGVPLADVIRRMSAARGYPVPEMPEQYDWMKRYDVRRGT
jgi:protein-tyrosine phosphatase